MMNNYDEETLKHIIRNVIDETENNDYIYTKNKVDIINSLDDDEEIERLLNINDIKYQFYMYSCGIVREVKPIEEQVNEAEKEQQVIKNKEFLKKNLDELIYDEIPYEEFYNKYLEALEMKRVRSIFSRRELKVSSSEDIEEVKKTMDLFNINEIEALNNEEIEEVLRENDYKFELIFDENNNGYIGIVKK